MRRVFSGKILGNLLGKSLLLATLGGLGGTLAYAAGTEANAA